MGFHLPLALLSIHFLVCAHAGSSSIENLLLRGNRTNSCNSGQSLLDDGECIQKLAELYFGQSVTLICPEIGVKLARLKCTGCPWDRWNHSVANYQTVYGRVDNGNTSLEEISSLLFHPARKSCSYVQLLLQLDELSIDLTRIDLLAVLLPSLANIFLSSADSSGATKTANIFGYTLSEPIYVAALLLPYVIGQGFAAISRTHYDICESLMAANPIWVSMVVNFVLILHLIMRRALKLRTPDVYRHLQSWALYRESRLEPSRRKRLFLDFLCVGGPAIVMIMALLERVGMPWLAPEPSKFGRCFIGQIQDRLKDLWYYVESSVLFMTAVVVSFGPPRFKTLFVIRYIILCLIVLWVLLAYILRHLHRFKVHSRGMLIPLVRSHDFDIGLTGITCTLVLAILGLAEPLRVGWDGQGNPAIANNICIEDNFSRLA